jgi:hypothetical protein
MRLWANLRVPAKDLRFQSAYVLLRRTSRESLKLGRRAAACCSAFLREETENDTMAKDDRDILELLKQELSFIEKGGYGRSVRAPWLPKSIFQDSLSCLNYGYPYRAHPCAECQLLEFVGPDDRSQTVPCHFIPLNEAGKTIAELEMEGDEVRTENAVKSWLQGRISRLEAEVAESVLTER